LSPTKYSRDWTMTPRSRLVLAALFALLQFLPASRSKASELDAETQHRIADAVQDAIHRGELPGAVVLIMHRSEVVFRKAFGQRSLKPSAEPMTADTLF